MVEVQRKIIHVDMDAFYASVEQRDDPKLRGKPVVVGGSPNSRGVVCAASYEAREFGVRSALPASQAYRLCPHAVFLRPRFEVYSAISRQIREIFARYTDLVEPLSLDEAFLDVTRNHRGIPSATEIAQQIRRAIKQKTRLTASAGIAPNKFLAKVASDVNKPDGFLVIKPAEVAAFLETLPIRRIPGIGKVTELRCHELGIRVCGDFLPYEESELIAQFGRAGSWFFEMARGRDSRPVEPSRVRKSCGVEETFERDLNDLGHIHQELEPIAEELHSRLRKHDTKGRRVVLKLKYADFQVVTRSKTLPEPVAEKERLLAIAHQLLQATEAGERPVRLLGLSVSQLERDDLPRQLRLPFPDP